MKLFGKDKTPKQEEVIETPTLAQDAPETPVENAAPTAPAEKLVLAIEDFAPKAESEAEQTLRGATNALPDQKQIEEAIEAAEEAVENTAAEAAEQAEEAEKEDEPSTEAKESEKLASVSYASVAQAVVNAKKEPTGRYDRDAVDDETLLAELYALIGDPSPKKTTASTEPQTVAPVQPRPVSRPATRITQEALQAEPDTIEIEEDTAGVPGWLKGVFILLISLLLSAMTFYAVASDVMGKIF